MTVFNELFEKLARYNDRSIIWNNWLNYIIQLNLMNTNTKEINFYNNEKHYMTLLQEWLNELSLKLESQPYYDLLGQFYEELVQSKSKSKSLGQAYTPSTVTELMSELTINNNEEGFVYDPTCGSSRTLLSAHVKSKGDVICIGQDLDLTSCYMSVLNFWSHGVRGSILHMDTLTGAFHQGWRVNKYLYHGLPIPHIEEIYSVDEAYNFMGLKHDGKKLVELNKPVIENYDTQNKTVQSKLM